MKTGGQNNAKGMCFSEEAVRKKEMKKQLQIPRLVNALISWTCLLLIRSLPTARAARQE